MAKELKEFKHYFAEKLRDPKYATAYLNVALMDEDPGIFLLALKNICEARGEEMAELV